MPRMRMDNMKVQRWQPQRTKPRVGQTRSEGDGVRVQASPVNSSRHWRVLIDVLMRSRILTR